MSVPGGGGLGPQVNKLKQVPSEHHQMSVGWLVSHVWGEGRDSQVPCLGGRNTSHVPCLCVCGDGGSLPCDLSMVHLMLPFYLTSLSPAKTLSFPKFASGNNRVFS